jgi:L-ascorbate metabolism protein UlaG (beta-lactamase superfamily)
MLVTMVGHCTVLIEISGRRIITDPYFGTLGHVAYARLNPPALTREELRDVDLVLISHNHWDHTDREFIRSLPEGVPVLVPKSARWITKLRGARFPEGMAAWQEKHFEGFSVSAVPALHIVPTVGYVIQGEHKAIYFAGDTYYGRFMREVGQRFQLDAALMPVTTYRIPMTMGEPDAVRAVRVLKPGLVIPIHLGLNPRTALLRTGHTPEGFQRRLREAGLGTEVVVLQEGQTREI